MSPGITDKNAGAPSLLAMATRIAATYLQNNPAPASQVPEIIRTIHRSLASLAGQEVAPATGVQEPAVPVKRSVRPDHLICLEDGKKLKMLRRYLKSRYNMTPEAYRAKWGLPADYPMVAPSYAAQRSEFAKKIGLGRGHRKS